MASKIVGLEKLRRRLKRMPQVSKTEIRKAIGDSAAEIVAMQKRNAPVDEGDLRDSIGWTFGEAPSTRATGAFRAKRATFVTEGDDIRATIYAGDDKAFYARWVEFGTAAGVRGRRAGARSTDVAQNKTAGRIERRTHPGTRPRPFFYAPYRLLKKKVKGRINRAIGKAARQVAKS